MHPLALKIVPPFQVLILGALMWLNHRYLAPVHWHTGYEFIASRILLLMTLGLFVAAIYQFWRHQTTVNPRRLEQTSALIETGVFSLSRNPIYVVDVLLLLSWSVWLAEWSNLALVMVFILYVSRFQIEPEEAVLAEKFGDQYRDYRSRVRRWI